MAISHFDVCQFNDHLKANENEIGQKLVYKEVTGSTMDDARRLGHEG